MEFLLEVNEQIAAAVLDENNCLRDRCRTAAPGRFAH